MAHAYSHLIHKWISIKIEKIKSQKISAERENDTDTKEYLSGQLEELLFFRRYLSEHFDLETQAYHK